jgi:hypothetical protein
MSTKKTKTKTKAVAKKSVAKTAKKVVSASKKSTKTKSKKTTKAPKPILPPKYIDDIYNYDAELNPEYAFSDDISDDVTLNNKYYYAVNHTTKIKALIVGEDLPYEYALTIAEKVTENTSEPEKDNIHVAEIGFAFYWILKKIFKIREYEL